MQICNFKNECTVNKCILKHPNELLRRQNLCHFDTRCTDKVCIFRHTCYQESNVEKKEDEEEEVEVELVDFVDMDDENMIGEILGVADDRVYDVNDKEMGVPDYSLILFNGKGYIIMGSSYLPPFSTFDEAADWMIDQLIV